MGIHARSSPNAFGFFYDRHTASNDAEQDDHRQCEEDIDEEEIQEEHQKEERLLLMMLGGGQSAQLARVIYVSRFLRSVEHLIVARFCMLDILHRRFQGHTFL